MNKPNLVVDTSVFMQQLDDKLLDQYHIIIPTVVIDELDNLKDNRQNSHPSYKARNAIKFINDNYDKFEFKSCNDNIFSNDNQIIDVAERYNCALMTYDMCMKVKARILGLKVLELDKVEDDYKGYKIIELDTNNDQDNQLLASIYENSCKNIWDLYVNQYLIIKDKNEDKTIDILRWDGQKFVKLKLPPKKAIASLNDLQMCALDLLNNNDIPIRFIIGEIGSGKTFLAIKLGLYYTLDKGLYNKVLVIRNPIGAGEKIGSLPGTKLEKINDFYKPIEQNASIINLDTLIDNDQLEFDIPFFIKGNTYDNTWMIIDEAEDFDIKTLRLIGGRIGKDSCINFCGDYKQSEHKFQDNNGLRYAIDKLKGNPLVGIIFLEDNVRSSASNVFLDL